MIEAGASPVAIQAILECAHTVHPHQLSTCVLYQDTLRKAMLEALRRCSRAVGDVHAEQLVEQNGDPVKLILSAVSQYEAGG